MGVNFLQGKEISCNSWLQGFGCLNIFIGTGRLTAIQSSWPLVKINLCRQQSERVAITLEEENCWGMLHLHLEPLCNHQSGSDLHGH